MDNNNFTYTDEIDFLATIIDKKKKNHRELYDLVYKIAIDGMRIDEAHKFMIDSGVDKTLRTYQTLLNKLSKGKLKLIDFKMMYNINNPKYIYQRYTNNKNYNKSKYSRDYMPPKKRYSIMLRDGFKCVICGREGNGIKLQIDHIIPISKGGDDSEDNLRTLCALCNLGKGNIIEEIKK